MDFDPSEFLAMAMSEDQDAVYTAPDIQEPCSNVVVPQGMVTVEGGLEMEKNVQLPIPTFDTLDVQSSHIEDVEEYNNGQSNGYDINQSSLTNGDPLEIVTAEISTSLSSQEQKNSPAQPSPIDRTASPNVGKKIHASYDEQRFRKEFFNGKYERVRLFRLHCTICDKHLGCAPWFTERQMRMHKLLSVCVCRKCFDFYGDINFPVEDGSEIYCFWCGEGGELFCCGTCPKAVCKKCLKRNFGSGKVKEVEDNDNWCCFVCKPDDIWPHRAIMWGMQRFGKEMRQQVVSLPKEEKQAILSKDTAHCCPKINEKCSSISLPSKKTLSKVPLCLIAVTHQSAVRNQPDKPEPDISFLGKALVTPFRTTNTTKQPPFTNTIVGQQNFIKPPPLYQGGPTHQNRAPMFLENSIQPPHPPPGILQFASPARHLLYRSTVNRAAPYPVNRPGHMMVKQYPSQTVPPGKTFLQIQPPVTRYMQNPSTNRSSQLETIDLVEEPQIQHVSTKSISSPNYDILWLETGIKKVNNTLLSVNKLTDEFNLIYGDLKNDLSKIDSYFDQLSIALKMAICNLAKVNQDMIEGKKMALDKTVSSVVNEIQLSGIIPSLSNGRQTPPCTPTPYTKRDLEPKVAPVSLPAPKPGSSGGDDEVGDVNPALFCEAVLEVDGNKENNNGNKVLKTPENITTSKLPISTRKRPRGRPPSKMNSSIN